MSKKHKGVYVAQITLDEIEDYVWCNDGCGITEIADEVGRSITCINAGLHILIKERRIWKGVQRKVIKMRTKQRTQLSDKLTPAYYHVDTME